MKGQAGMGLIEMMVGIGLLAICLIGLNSLVVALIGGNLSSRLIDTATHLGEARLHDLRSIPFDQVKTGSTTELWSPYPTGKRALFYRTTLIEAGVFPTTRTVTVTVQWNDRGTRHIALSSELAR